MRPNNEHTNLDQRFFFPNENEIEYHESLYLAAAPKLKILEGEIGYVVTTEDGIHETADFVDNVGDNLSGQRVTKVVGTYHSIYNNGSSAPLTAEYKELEKILNHPLSDTYEVNEGDLLVVRAHMKLNQIRDPLFESHGLQETLVLPATEPLPYSNEESTGDLRHEVTYDIEGIITKDLKLIGWPGATSSQAAGILDLCIANAWVSNKLELTLLIDSLNSGSSLIDRVNQCKVMKTFLEHYDRTNGTRYLPSVDPRDKVNYFPEMDENQFKQYLAVSALARNLTRGVK